MKLRDQYLQKVMRKIVCRKKYPKRLRRMKIEGQVVVEFEINSDGSLARALVTSSAGHVELDDLALQLIQNSANFPKFPKGLEVASLSLALPIEYSLAQP